MSEREALKIKGNPDTQEELELLIQSINEHMSNPDPAQALEYLVRAAFIVRKSAQTDPISQVVSWYCNAIVDGVINQNTKLLTLLMKSMISISKDRGICSCENCKGEEACEEGNVKGSKTIH